MLLHWQMNARMHPGVFNNCAKEKRPLQYPSAILDVSESLYGSNRRGSNNVHRLLSYLLLRGTCLNAALPAACMCHASEHKFSARDMAAYFAGTFTILQYMQTLQTSTAICVNCQQLWDTDAGSHRLPPATLPWLAHSARGPSGHCLGSWGRVGECLLPHLTYLLFSSL